MSGKSYFFTWVSVIWHCLPEMAGQVQRCCPNREAVFLTANGQMTLDSDL